MKKTSLIPILLMLGLALRVLGQGTPPPVSLGGSAGVAGGQSLAGQYQVPMADANYTLNSNEWWQGNLVVPSSVTLTATRTVTLPVNPGQQYVIDQYSTGGQSVLFKASTGTGVTVANGQHGIAIHFDGTNYVAGSTTATCAGIGAVCLVPSGSQMINLSAVALPTLPANTNFGVVGVSGSASRILNISNGGTAYFTSMVSAGTAGSPTAVVSGQELGGYNSGGYDGTAYGVPAAAFRTFAAQNWAVGAHGTKINFATTPNGATSEATVLTMEQDGGMDTPTATGGDKGPGTVNTAGCFVNGVPCGLSSSYPALVAQPTPSSTTFLQSLNTAKIGVVRIKLVGDSFLICDHRLCGLGGGPVIGSNRWPEQIRIQLQAIYGSHGTGVQPIIFGMGSIGSTPPINTEEWSCTGSVDNNTNSLGIEQTGTNAGTTLLHMATGAVCTFNDSRGLVYTNFSVLYATPAGTSSLAIVADGTTSLGAATSSSSAVSGAVNAGLTARRFDGSTTLAATIHSIALTCTGDCYLAAGDGQNGTTGVSVDNFGSGGVSSNSFGASVTNQMAFADLVTGGTQMTAIEDMTNDVALSVSTSTFNTNIGNLITHEQALASRPTVMVIIPPVDVVNNTEPMAAYTAILVAICATDNLTCTNIQTRGTTVGGTLVGWGTTYLGGTTLGAPYWDLTGVAWPTGNAGVHPSDAGSIDKAQMIYAQMVNPTCSYNCTLYGNTTFLNPSANVLTITSTNSIGVSVTLSGTGTNVDTWQIVNGGNGVLTGGKSFLIGDGTTGTYGWRLSAPASGAGLSEYPSLMVLGWAPTFSVTGNTPDTGFSRTGINAAALGNGTQGDTTGTLQLGTLKATTFSPTTASSTAVNAVSGNGPTNLVGNFSNTVTGSASSGISIVQMIAPNGVATSIPTFFFGIDTGTSLHSASMAFSYKGGSATPALNYPWLGLTGASLGVIVCSDGSLGVGYSQTSTCPQTAGGITSTGPIAAASGSTVGSSLICTAAGTVVGCPALAVSNAITSATGGTGTGAVTCLTVPCTNLRGTYSVAGGTFTTGNLLALVWPTTATAYVCTATMNGGTGFLGIGNDVATATGVNISAGVSILGLTVIVNYECKP